jgi:hypothetical protein
VKLFKELKVTPNCFVTDHDTALKAALTALYPKVVQRCCIWHINQNVLTAAHKAYDLKKAHSDEAKIKELHEGRNDFMARWHDLVSRPTQKMFWDAYKAIENNYADQPTLLQYLNNHQMPHFEQWAECFCRYMPDYGIQVTASVLSDAADKEFEKLERLISPFPLRPLKPQLQLAKAESYDNGEACTGAYTLKYGLPCKHFLHHRIQQQVTAEDDPKAIYYLNLAQVDQHWFLDPPRARGLDFGADSDVFRPLDPLKIKSKGRPRGATSKSLPKAKKSKMAAQEPRDRSRFKHSQAEQDSVRAPASQASQAPKKRTVKRTVTKKVREEIIEDEIEEEGVEEPSFMTRVQAMLQASLAPLQQQIAELERRNQMDAIEISSDKDSDDKSDDKSDEEENRESDDDFPVPDQVEMDEEDEAANDEPVASNYGTRS